MTNICELEVYIDKTSLSNVLDELADICNEKAEHIRTNWQDGLLAKEWEKAAKALEHLSFKVTI